MLQALIESGTAGCAADQNPLARISLQAQARSPTLEPEHGVKHKEGDQGVVVGTVGSGTGNPRRHGSRLINTLLQNPTALSSR